MLILRSLAVIAVLTLGVGWLFGSWTFYKALRIGGTPARDYEKRDDTGLRGVGRVARVHTAGTARRPLMGMVFTGLALVAVTVTSCGVTEDSTPATTPATPVGADDELVSRCLVAADLLGFDDFSLVAAIDGGISPGAGEVGLVCTIALTDGELASIFAPQNSPPRVIDPPSP